ncbi:MAG: hypothetical protein LBI17_03455, partial [Rickettsiales bacterium]|nr:hypothetical protein [Rickettsiales bacterium]
MELEPELLESEPLEPEPLELLLLEPEPLELMVLVVSAPADSRSPFLRLASELPLLPELNSSLLFPPPSLELCCWIFVAF